MFKTRTIKATQPDIFSCCGCLDEVFAKVNLDKASPSNRTPYGSLLQRKNVAQVLFYVQPGYG